MAGEYLSVFKGRGMEFDEVRPYVPGDDVRAIDWNVTARTGEPFVKRFVEERELTVMLLVDVSASQDFGSAARSKLEAAVRARRRCSRCPPSNGDKVGLLLFHGGADHYIPPRKGASMRCASCARCWPGARTSCRRSARPTMPPRKARAASSVCPRRSAGNSRVCARPAARTRGASTRIGHALEFCQRVLPRRAVLFLISDFLDDGYLPALRSTRRRHDLVAVLMTDERERQIEGAGIVTLEDAETGERRLVDTGSGAFQEAVNAEAARRQKRLRDRAALLRRRSPAYRRDPSVVDPLLQFFRMRQRRRRR